jgi:nitrate reductase delta subunit
MVEDATTKRVLCLFANILDYPSAGTVSEVQECQRLLSGRSPEAAAFLGEFHTLAENSPSGRLEELYTGVFDLDPVCQPYVGYHMFGESYKRSTFMVILKEEFRKHDFEQSGTDLPDRLSTLLRFLSVCDDDDLAQEIIDLGMVPALDKMMKGVAKEEKGLEIEDKFASAMTQLEGEGTEDEILQGGFVLEMSKDDGEEKQQVPPGTNPYQPVLRALSMVLQSAEFTRVGERSISAANAGGGLHA